MTNFRNRLSPEMIASAFQEFPELLPSGATYLSRAPSGDGFCACAVGALWARAHGNPTRALEYPCLDHEVCRLRGKVEWAAEVIAPREDDRQAALHFVSGVENGFRPAPEAPEDLSRHASDPLLTSAFTEGYAVGQEAWHLIELIRKGEIELNFDEDVQFFLVGEEKTDGPDPTVR